MTFFLIEMKFSLPQAKQNLTALHPLSESCWDSQTSLHDDESTDITPGVDLLRNQPLCWPMCHMASLSVLARLRVSEMCGWGVESPLLLFARCLRAGYLSLQQAATRLLHLIVSSAHSRWEGPTSQDTAPRQWYTCSAATGVAALFFLCSPRGIRHRGEARVIWRRGREKSMTNDLAFFLKHIEKNSSFYVVILLPYIPVHHSK